MFRFPCDPSADYALRAEVSIATSSITSGPGKSVTTRRDVTLAAAAALQSRSTMEADPVITNPHFYSVIFENKRVRVLEYFDEPGAQSVPHEHPDSVMVTLNSFSQRLSSGGTSVELEEPADKPSSGLAQLGPTTS